MSRIKECFTSRWGDDGVIMEADYSQLEVVGLAITSGDSVLKQDILGGIDFHIQTACWLYGYDYDYFKALYDAGDPASAKMRQEAKEPNFLNQYGGGAFLMSKNTGIPLQKCQTFIDSYYERYAGVKAYQDALMDEVKSNRMPSKKVSNSGIPLGMGWYTSLTGRRYVFYEYESDRKDRFGNKLPPSFSPTEMKNYAVQGFATGDIVPEILGRLYRVIAGLKYSDKCKLIGTVHDSIVLDVHKDVVDETSALVQTIMENAPYHMNKRYGIEIDMPLKATVSVADCWANTK